MFLNHNLTYSATLSFKQCNPHLHSGIIHYFADYCVKNLQLCFKTLHIWMGFPNQFTLMVWRLNNAVLQSPFNYTFYVAIQLLTNFKLTLPLEFNDIVRVYVHWAQVNMSVARHYYSLRMFIYGFIWQSMFGMLNSIDYTSILVLYTHWDNLRSIRHHKY